MDGKLWKSLTWVTLVILVWVPLAEGIASKNVSPVQMEYDLTTENSQQNIELLGQFGGAAQAVKVRAGYAYVGFGTGFEVLNIADPAQIQRLGWLSADGKVVDISINGNYAYLAYRGKLRGENGPVGLDILDISHPEIPVILNSLEFRYCGSSPKVIVNGFDLYFAYDACDAFGGIIQNAGAHLLRLDISTPTKPTILAEYEIAMSSIMDIALGDDKLYAIFNLADPTSNTLKVFDVSSPSEMVAIGSAIVSEHSHEISLEGNYAFIASEADGLQVTDVSDPYNPIPVITYTLPAEAWTIHIQGSTAFIGTDASQILLVDITDPLNPAMIGTYNTSGQPTDIDIQDGAGYLTNGVAGFEIFDISTLSRSGLLTYPQGINKTDYSSPFAYLAADNGFWILDITNPRMPVIQAHLATCQPAVSVALKSGYAILACPDDGLRMIDISNPSSPVLAGSYSLPVPLNGLDLVGDRLYVIAGAAGMWILHVANPLTPQQIGLYTPSSSINAVAAEGSLVYLGSDQGNLAIVDTSNPSSPEELAVLDPPDQVGTGQSCTDVAVQNSVVVLTTVEPPPTPLAGYFTGDVWLIDASNPENPNLVGHIPNGYGFAPEGVNLKNDRLFVVYERQGLVLYDIQSISSPAQIGVFEPNEYIDGVGDAGEYLLLFNGNLYLTRYLDPNLPSISGWITHPNRRPKPGVLISIENPHLEKITDPEGGYTFHNLSENSYMIVPSLSGYVFSPASRMVNLSADAFNQNFTILAPPVSALFTPGVSLTLAYTDTMGLPTQLDVPENAFDQQQSLSLIPQDAEPAPGYAFTGHAFEIKVEPPSNHTPEFNFATPMTLTIQYNLDDVAIISDTQALALWWWNGSLWEDASQTCTPSGEYLRDLENLTISLPICQSGVFKLMGPTHQVILPIIMREK